MNVRNPARERLSKGELCLGIGLRQARTVDVAAAMASCGFDWLFIDHGDKPPRHNEPAVAMYIQAAEQWLDHEPHKDAVQR